MLRWWNKLRGYSCDPPVGGGLFAPVVVRFERISYLRAVAVVGAKLAKVDGPVRRSEIDAFKRLFLLHPQESSQIAKLFDLARETPEGFEPFVAQLAEMLADNPAATEDLFDRLHSMALVDGGLTQNEIDYLTAVARSLGVEAHWEVLRTRSGAQGDPYSVLGIGRHVSDREVRAAWQRLSRQYHPDAVAARGEGEPDHERMAAINSAYRRIMHMRRQRVPL